MVDVVHVEPKEEHKLYLRFDDGVSGIVDIASVVEFTGVFKALIDLKEFRKVSVDPELGVICWPNGADLDTLVLHSRITGKPIVLNSPHE